jgi:hypothetical protein
MDKFEAKFQYFSLQESPTVSCYICLVIQLELPLPLNIVVNIKSDSFTFQKMELIGVKMLEMLLYSLPVILVSLL